MTLDFVCCPQDMTLLLGGNGLLAKDAEMIGKLAVLLVVCTGGFALGWVVRKLRDVQRMQQQLQGVPAPPPPSKPLQRWLHEWLGPVLPLYR